MRRELSPHTPAWEIQPKEPAQLFAAFVVFRNQGLTRTLAETARVTDTPVGRLHKTSTAWRWADRARAWDQHQAVKQSEVVEEARRSVAERHAKIAAQYMNVMAAPVVELGRRMAVAAQSGGQALAGVSDADLWKLVQRNAPILRALVDTERLSHQMPTEHRAISAPDGGPVQVTTVVEAVRRIFDEGQDDGNHKLGSAGGVRDAEDVQPVPGDDGGA